MRGEEVEQYRVMLDELHRMRHSRGVVRRTEGSMFPRATAWQNLRRSKEDVQQWVDDREVGTVLKGSALASAVAGIPVLMSSACRSRFAVRSCVRTNDAMRLR